MSADLTQEEEDHIERMLRRDVVNAEYRRRRELERSESLRESALGGLRELLEQSDDTVEALHDLLGVARGLGRV
ncbi:hypothetical protein, partial [Bacillus subtilis]|uniref:hypothetical protein n=1 Tax=Bacillus subtilis TaxID=1423 RepID=UPI0039807602